MSRVKVHKLSEALDWEMGGQIICGENHFIPPFKSV